MIRIVIGGLQKDLIKKQVEETGGDRVEAVITSDFEGAKKVKAGQADYYVGACNSGGGAALSVAIGLLGYNRCATIAKAGGRPDPQEIEKRVQEGENRLWHVCGSHREYSPYSSSKSAGAFG